MAKSQFKIIPLTDKNREEHRKIFVKKWGADFMVTKGKVHHYEDLSGFLLLEAQKVVGMITFIKHPGEIEITSLNSMRESRGIGNWLVEQVVELARKEKRKRLWLITTNDNLNAMKFYQKREWSMCAIHLNGADRARKLKPTIPKFGYFGIPIEHEVEFEYRLNWV